MADKDERLFDKRTVERNIEKGLITREEYEEYLENLEDSSENVTEFEAEYEVGVLEDDEDEEETDEETAEEEEADEEEADDSDDSE